jgi:hypothetical protein
MRSPLRCVLVALCLGFAAVIPAGGTSADPDAVRREFIAAMERVQQHLPDLPDSPALEAYVIHDYLVAARLRRDLAATPGEALDAIIDSFVRTHAGQPVERALRHDWLVSLANRQRWDWFLPRSTDAADAQILCDRLNARLATRVSRRMRWPAGSCRSKRRTSARPSLHGCARRIC